jgi:hypothetical protein
MNFFSSAVEMLETITAALGAGLQEWKEFKNKEKCQAITREFISRRLIRKSGKNRIHFRMNLIMAGGGPPPPHFFQKKKKNFFFFLI